MLFFSRKENSCWICGSENNLSREHKFKASDLKAVFGNDEMDKFKGDLSIDQIPKTLLSPKSRNAKFKASICIECNGALTQPADRSYERFSQNVRDLMARGVEPFEIANESPWRIPTHEDSINCLRYFAKAVGCHAAEVSAPIPCRLADFASVNSPISCITCTINSNEQRRDFAAGIPPSDSPFQYVSHHGLAVMFDNEVKSVPISYRSGLSIDWADVVFEFPFSCEEQRQLVEEYREFLDYAKENMY